MAAGGILRDGLAALPTGWGATGPYITVYAVEVVLLLLALAVMRPLVGALRADAAAEDDPVAAMRLPSLPEGRGI